MRYDKKATLRLLVLFFENKTKQFTLRDLCRLTDLSEPAVTNNLVKLIALNLVDKNHGEQHPRRITFKAGREMSKINLETGQPIQFIDLLKIDGMI